MFPGHVDEPGKVGSGNQRVPFQSQTTNGVVPVVGATAARPRFHARNASDVTWRHVAQLPPAVVEFPSEPIG